MPLPVQLASTGASTCELQEYRMTELVVRFPIPLADTDLVTLLKVLAADPSLDQATSGDVLATRMRDGITVKVGSGTFFIRYPVLLPLIAA